MRAIQLTAKQGVLACGFVSILGGAVLAGSHTWDVNEIFSNAHGNIQFIELWEAAGNSGEWGLPAHDVTSNSNVFDIPGGGLPGDTTNKYFLIATQAFANQPGAPTPDAIIPQGLLPFFSVDGDTVTYDPWDALTFALGELPTDGVLSLNFDLSTGVNSPTNYAGDTGSVDVSGPPTCTNVGDCSGHGTCIATDACSCDEGWTGDDCASEEIIVPTVSQWGLIALALLLSATGTALVVRRRAAAI